MRVLRALLSPWVDMELCLSPERAASMFVFLVPPLQGFVLVYSCTQGGAPRLRRYALPWSDIWLPVRGGSEPRPSSFGSSWLHYVIRPERRCPTSTSHCSLCGDRHMGIALAKDTTSKRDERISRAVPNMHVSVFRLRSLDECRMDPTGRGYV